MQAVSQKTGHPLIGCKRRLGNVTSGSRAGKLTNHIAFLDELRGVAALSVVLLHASQIFGFSLGSYAYLAVDFFFCLSGFVLAHGYDQKLRSGGLRSSAFFLKRLARLYPMIVVGVAVGVLAAVFASEPHISLHDIPILTVGALLLLPLGLLAGQEAFSINSPLWSLCFEMVASVVYGSAARRKIRLWGDVAFLAFFAVALFQIVGIEGTIGPVGFSSWRTFLEGFVRVGFSFFAGVLIFRWNINHRVGRVPPQIPLFILIVVLFLPFSVPRGLYDFFCITIIIPVVVALAAAVPPNEERPLAAYFGLLSYPLYAIHQPIIRLGAQFQSTSDGVIPLAITVSGTLLAAIAAAHFLFTHFDKPIRAYMCRKFSLN
ncbi:peptidoglycan/LPS O-acetylase OafA/YrhL [Rhizobium leguminosarum]